FDARVGISNAVHDDLYVRALVLSDGAIKAALVSVEVIAISAKMSLAIRRQVEHATGIPLSQIFLCATHTHCGPVTLHHFFNQGQPLDEAYLERLTSTVVDTIRQAADALKPRVLKTAMVPCGGIAVNRRTADGLPVDPFAGVLLVEEMTGERVAIGVFYACHTTVLGPNTLSITQDFPFYTLEALRRELGPEVEPFYINGAEGDLSIGHKSDLSAVGVIDSFRTFETAQRLGEKLAQAVLTGMTHLVEEQPLLDVRSAYAPLPLKSYDPLPEMAERRRLAIAALADSKTTLAAKQTALFARIEEYYARLYEESQTPEPKYLPAEIGILRLGGTAFVSLPGEIFVCVALAIRERSPFPRTLFLGLANDYIGYLPDEFASTTSGYEVVASRVPAEAGRVLQQHALQLLEQAREVVCAEGEI
ncbi:hypothetical protein AB4043_23710, partial [Terriglobus sp. YAF25]